MLITSENYRQAIIQLKNDYSDLPWYQRWWFSLWAYSLSDALSDIDLINPTTEQVDELIKMSDESWFFNSIFGLLTQFKEAIGNLSFSGLPKETKAEIGIRLPFKDLMAFASTSKKNCAFFESLRLPNQFLHDVAHGEYDAIATMLEKNIDLLLHKGPIKDASGRTFFNISGFQYALWALDKHMWSKMLECLPQNEKGAKIKARLLQQYQELEEKGVAYELNSQRIRENHFDFKNTIIKELNTLCIDRFYGFKSSEEINTQWRKGVGLAQEQLPMHVVYEYCSKEPFDPIPKFKQPPPRITRPYNYNLDWFHIGLGENYAVSKGGYRALLMDSPDDSSENAKDLFAMEALYEIRTADFIELKSLLKEPLPLEVQFSASP